MMLLMVQIAQQLPPFGIPAGGRNGNVAIAIVMGAMILAVVRLVMAVVVK